jgi:hypothetical protein
MKTSAPPAEFVKAGIPARNWFGHYVLTIAKQYPDTFLYLNWRTAPRRATEAAAFRQINLYATDLDGLPDELFTDKSVNWHQQQLGLKGHIASAGLYLHGLDDVFVMFLQSDLSQQLFRHAELRAQCRTQIDSRFGHWYQLLLNAVLDFCVDRGVKVLYVPTCRTILRFNVKPVQAQLFARIYDDAPRRFKCDPSIVGGAEYWRIPIADNLTRIARLSRKDSLNAPPPSGVCIFHDIEEDVDTDVSKEECKRWFLDLLRIEREASVPTTYSILGSLFKDKMPHLMAHGVRSLAFHSYDHSVDGTLQLPRLRKVDHQVRGYRPPKSRITSEITDYGLSFYNFEWLLSSAGSLNSPYVCLENGIVKIPVHIDDYPLHTGRLTLEQWDEALLQLLDRVPLVVIGLHDCYASKWINSYDRLLERLQSCRQFLTCDQIADAVFLASVAEASPSDAPRAGSVPVVESAE